MTEKYSLLPLNPQQLPPVQTAIQRMSEKHLDFEIEPVNTMQPLEIKYMPCSPEPEGNSERALTLKMPPTGRPGC